MSEPDPNKSVPPLPAPSEGKGLEGHSREKHGFFSRGKSIPHEKNKPSLSEKEIAALQEKAAQADKLRDQFLRLGADFDNYRKRVARENEEKTSAATDALLLQLLPVLDDFERAVAAVQDDGLGLLLNKFRTVLGQMGLEEIHAAGQKFDPNLHEAVAQVPHDSLPEGSVIEQTRKGYRRGPRLLRPASVIVSQGPAPLASQDASKGLPGE